MQGGNASVVGIGDNFEFASGKKPPPEGLPVGVVVSDPRLPCPWRVAYGNLLALSTCVSPDPDMPTRMDPTQVHMIEDDTGRPLYEGLELEAEPVIVTWSDVALLPIESGQVLLQPPSGDHLIHMETVARSTATEHTLTASVVGVPVEVRLTPVSWDWHFGQDIPDFTTHTPGGTYPDLSVSGVYTRVEQGLNVTATITWAGHYRIGQSENWYPILG